MLSNSLTQRFADEMGRLIGPNFPKSLVLAVSGGGDSMAMLHLAVPWARVMGIKLYACTINHNLRPEACDEIALVAEACKGLGVFHQVLDWQWNGQGNVQDAARRARLELINQWRGAVNTVLMAHTQDDQAETVLMRLARGSGVEGLAAMAPRREVPTATSRRPLHQQADGPPWPHTMDGRMYVVRPLLGESREALRHYLKTLHIGFAEDPSNEDSRFERVKIRQAWDNLEALGLTRERLSATASRMAASKEVLSKRAVAAHMEAAQRGHRTLFDVVYDRDDFARIERDTQLRLLAAALQFVSLAPYRPRLATLESALDRALAGGATTLHGGYIYPQRAALYVCAEYQNVKDLRPENGIWRGLYACGDKDVRPLGEAGAAQIRDLTDLPARVLWPVPAVWDGEKVLGTPRLGKNPHWNPTNLPDRFMGILTSH